MRFAGETSEMAALFRLVSFRRMNPATNLIQERANSFLTLDKTRRHTQRVAASFGIDGEQLIDSRHNRSCNRVLAI